MTKETRIDDVEEADTKLNRALEEWNRAQSHEKALIEEANRMNEEHNTNQVKQEYGKRIQGAVDETESAADRVFDAFEEAHKIWRAHRKINCPPILDN